MSAFPTGIVYLGELTAAGAVSDTDTTFWCDVSTGGTVGVPLKRISAAQLAAFFTGKSAGFSAIAPLQLSGGSLTLLTDSTLAVIGGRLSVVGGVAPGGGAGATPGGGAVDTPGGGAIETPGGTAALARIAELTEQVAALEARLAMLEEQK